MTTAIRFAVVAGLFAMILVGYIQTRRSLAASLRAQERLAAHLERLTFAFIAQIPDALSATPIYDKLGQKIGVQRLVVELYDRVMADPELSPYFTGVDMDRLRRHQVTMFTALFGVEPYDGLDLTVVHADLGITNKHFDRLLEHVAATLRSFGLAEPERAVIIGWLEAQRVGIVGAAPLPE